MGKKLSKAHPQEAEDLGGNDVNGEETPEGRAIDGSNPARIPSRQGNQFADRGQAKGKKSGLQPGQTARRLQNEREDHPNRQRGNFVDSVLVFQCGVNIHGGVSVLDFDAPENDRAREDQHFAAGVAEIRSSPDASLVRDAAENRRPAKRHLPSLGHTNLNATKDGVDFQRGLIRLHVGVGQIDFDAAKDGVDVPALKILTGYPPLDTAEDGGFTECRPWVAPAGRHGRSPSRLNGAPYQHQTRCDQQNRPDVIPTKVSEAQFIELKKHSSRNQQNAPKAALARHYIRDPRTNQEQRPETPEAVHGNIAHVVEEQGDSADYEECAPEEATAASPANVNAHHDRAAALFVGVHCFFHPRMNISMNLVVESITELLCIEIVL